MLFLTVGHGKAWILIRIWIRIDFLGWIRIWIPNDLKSCIQIRSVINTDQKHCTVYDSVIPIFSGFLTCDILKNSAWSWWSPGRSSSPPPEPSSGDTHPGGFRSEYLVRIWIPIRKDPNTKCFMK